MDPDIISTKSPEKAASPESSSVRPNPFADGDDSSRKRRRTSASGSPISAHAVVAHAQRGRGSASLDVHDLTSDSAMKLDNDSSAPQTPEQQLDSQELRVDPPSSKVTINLRHRQHSSSTSSPSHELSPAQIETNMSETRMSTLNAEELKESVESTEVDMISSRGKGLATPQSSSSSMSPPIEVIQIENDDDNDNDNDHSARQASAFIVEDDPEVLDPTAQFPYQEADDSLSETVTRLAQYIASQSGIDEHVVFQVQEWIEQYLQFITHTSHTTVVDSLLKNRAFWLELPDVITAMSSRRPPVLRSVALRSAALGLYSAFLRLTARFVTIDIRSIREFTLDANPSNLRTPSVFSIAYLQQLHSILTRDTQTFANRQSEPPEIPRGRPDPTSHLVAKFQNSPGGSTESLSKLANALIQLIPTFPKFANGLASISQILADCSANALDMLHAAPQDALLSKSRLKLAHDAWVANSDALHMMIDKHVMSLSVDTTNCQIQALTDLLKICLQGNHERATAALEEHRQQYPAFPLNHTCEAIAWQWRFNLFAKLIRCSQMPLRVTAVTLMCGDLVAVWKRLNDPEEDQSLQLMNHIGSCLLETKLIDYILGPNCHPEIIFESANIVGFLVITRMYRMEHTEQLWRGITESQDPRVADALTRMISTITNLFDYQGLQGLCEKLQSLPVESYSPAIRSLWDNVLREMVARSQAEHLVLSFHPYDLCLRLIRESSVCANGSQVAYPDMQQAALAKLRELLNHGPDTAGRSELYLSCLDDISAKSPTTLGSLWCLALAIRSNTNREMHVLTDKHDLVPLILGELDHAIRSGREAGVPAVLSGATHQPRREFLTNIIDLQPASLDNELGRKLWNTLVGLEAPCPEDRKAGWQILTNVANKDAFQNPYIQTCLSQCLPLLPTSCFCDGTLEFIQGEIRLFIDDDDFVLDDEAMLKQSGIEHLWRIILAADDERIVELAIPILTVEVYMESRAIMAYPFHRIQQLHLSFVHRCMHQLKEAARKMKAGSDGNSSEDDGSMVIVPSDGEIQQQERVFIRSLQLLRYFLEAHQSRPRFATADLRSLMCQGPYSIDGGPAHLKYQSFDGTQETKIKPVNIGKLNTAAALLASLRQETGFDNYRVYYRGHPFVPTENEICKSLDDLDIHEGLMLVRREESGPSPPARIKPGSSPLEMEILAHFGDLWEYLSMQHTIAKEIYHFLAKLPADGHIMDLFESEKTSHRDLFLPGQPYRSLYAIHALLEYTETARLMGSAGNLGISTGAIPNTVYNKALITALRFIGLAISDAGILEKTPKFLQMQILSSLMRTFVEFIREIHSLGVQLSPESTCLPSPVRCVDILVTATLAPANESPVALIECTFTAIMRLSLLDDGFWTTITSNDKFSSLAQRLLVDERKVVRKFVAEAIADTIEIESQVASSDGIGSLGNYVSSPSRIRYFWSVFSDSLAKVITVPDRCQEFFGILQILLLKSNSIVDSAVPDLPKIAWETAELLLNHRCTEDIDQIEPCDPVIEGLTSLLHLFLQIDDSLTLSTFASEDLADKLFWQHLFPSQSNSSPDPVPRVVLNTTVREKLCDIILRLTVHHRAKFRRILRSLNSLVPYYTQDDDDDPYLYELPCQFERSKAIRSACGYVGLRNLSNTCYLNSLLTQLFMNTGFRQFITAAQIRDPNGSQQLLFDTRKLFGYMQGSYRRYVDPTDLVTSIKTYDDTPIDIHTQMDVDEFYNLLFDRWEAQLIGAEEKKRLRSFFGGQLVQQIKSKECEHISERLEPFSAIQCEVKGKSSLKDSLQAYVDGEILEGDNKYKCSTCDRHVDAVKRACLKDIPDNLIFHLKRFDFNLRTLQRSKINDHFSFPEIIDMQPYTVEYLSEATSEQVEDRFVLVGVLVHSGTAESGHYYSYVRKRADSTSRRGWVEFNDDIVTSWDPSLMESSTFGGPDERSVCEPNGTVYDKTYSAYMLFYQRASSLRSGEQAVASTATPPTLYADADRKLNENILHENLVLLRRHCLFDPSHAAFVQRCFSQAIIVNMASTTDSHSSDEDEIVDHESQSHEMHALAMEMSLSHFDQVVSRAKDSLSFGSFCVMLRSSVTSCAKCALAFYEYFNMRDEAFRAVLQRNPEPNVRRFLGEALLIALQRISLEFPQLYYPKDNSAMSTASSSESDGDESRHRLNSPGLEPSILEGTVSMIKHLWRFFHVNIRSWDEYFGLVLGFAKLGDREVMHLLAEDFLLKLMRIIAADPTVELPANYARMLNNILRRMNNRPPSYVAIISLIGYLLMSLEPALGVETIVESARDRLGYAQTFPWTSEEVHFILEPPPQRPALSLFVEKLIEIDQAQSMSSKIVCRLALTGEHMDSRIFHTLKRNTQGDVSTQPMDSFLKMAGRYIDCASSTENAKSLIRHVCAQARNLQNSEGVVFLELLGMTLGFERSQPTDAIRPYGFSLGLVPDWAPYMLTYGETTTRQNAERLLEDEVFAFSPLAMADDMDSGDDERRELHNEVVRRLGHSCLVYLRDAHIKRRLQISREAAEAVLRVVGKCTPYFTTDTDAHDDTAAEFVALRNDIMDPLRRYIVEEIEDDGSEDWDGSYPSSDQLDNSNNNNNNMILSMHAAADVDLT